MKDSDVGGMMRSMLRAARVGGSYEPGDHPEIMAAIAPGPDGVAVSPDLVAVSRGVPLIMVGKLRTSRQAAYDRSRPDVLSTDARAVRQYAENGAVEILRRLASSGVSTAVAVAFSADSEDRFSMRPFLIVPGGESPVAMRAIPDLTPLSPWKITGYIESAMDRSPVDAGQVARRLLKAVPGTYTGDRLSLISSILMAMSSDRFSVTMMDGTDDSSYLSDTFTDMMSRRATSFRDPYNGKSYATGVRDVLKSASALGRSSAGTESQLRRLAEIVESSGARSSDFGRIASACASSGRRGLWGGDAAELLVTLANPRPGELFLDPFCGPGLTLSSAWEAVGDDETSPVGYTAASFVTACSMVLLHGHDRVPVMSGSPWDLLWAKGGRKPSAVASDLCQADTAGHGMFDCIRAALDDAGVGARVALLVPRACVVSDDQSDVSEREAIMKTNTLRAVVSLDGERFVLLFTAHKSGASDCIFYSLPAGGGDVGKMVARVRDGKRGVAGASVRGRARAENWWPVGRSRLD